MKFIFLLASLLAAVQAQSQTSIGAPAAGAVLHAGQPVTVQVVIPVSTSPEAGPDDISLVIGMVACPSSGCPAPTVDFGQILSVGKFEPMIGDTVNAFDNITITVPSGISGKAAIQVQRNYFFVQPQHANPVVEYASVAVQVGSGSSPRHLIL